MLNREKDEPIEVLLEHGFDELGTEVDVLPIHVLSRLHSAPSPWRTHHALESPTHSTGVIIITFITRHLTLISKGLLQLGNGTSWLTMKASTLCDALMTRNQLNVTFTRLNQAASAPTQGSSSAAGCDLRCLEDTVIRKGQSSRIKTGLVVAIPEGWEGQIRSRSSLGAKGMIMPNGVGTIDSDYRGELMVLATWIGEGDEFHLAKGERCAQLLLAPVPLVSFTEVDDVEALGDTQRGSGGFGSSGRF